MTTHQTPQIPSQDCAEATFTPKAYLRAAIELCAKRDGRVTGEGDAESYNRDPENFEPSQPNPYGIDSQPELYELWKRAYENAFEGAKK
jgi:hypothetical protein